MTLVLRWRRPDPPLKLRWRGPDDVTITALAAKPSPLPLAAIVGPPGRDGAAAGSYLHTQATASADWIVNHNLARRPAAVSVRSPGGLEVTAAVLHVSDNQLQIQFAAPQSGSVVVQ